MTEDINEILEGFLLLCLTDVRRKIEKIEKERAYLLAKSQRICDHLEVLRLCQKDLKAQSQQ